MSARLRKSTSELLAMEPSTVMGLLGRGEITRRDVFKVMSAAGVATFGMRMRWPKKNSR